MGAEHGVRGVVQVPFRLVAPLRRHLLGVVAGGVAIKGAGEFSPAPGVGGHLQGVVLHGGHWGGAGEHCRLSVVFRVGEGPGHGLQIADGPAQLDRRQLQPELVPGLQQDALRLHQPLAHPPVGSLAEVASLGVLGVGPAGHEGDAQIGNGGAGEDPQVGFLLQVSEDQPLPVPVQQVLAAPAVKD